MKHHILCINSGSSSIKFAMYDFGKSEELIADGAVERIGLPGGWLWLKDSQDKRLADRHDDFPAHTDAVKAMFTVGIEELRFPEPDGVGHRLVHGGPGHILRRKK